MAKKQKATRKVKVARKAVAVGPAAFQVGLGVGRAMVERLEQLNREVRKLQDNELGLKLQADAANQHKRDAQEEAGKLRTALGAAHADLTGTLEDVLTLVQQTQAPDVRSLRRELGKSIQQLIGKHK